jgi:hypothetical protein
LLLWWMLTHEERTGAVARTIVANDSDRTQSAAVVVAILERLHNRVPSCPEDDIRCCLGRLGSLAYGAVTFEKDVASKPTAT